MNCELHLVPLSCDRTGVGFTSHPLSHESNRLHLMKGHAKHFPSVEGQQYFYVKIAGCEGCCEVAKVVGIEEDVFILDRTTSTKCNCISSNTAVSYLWEDLRVVQDIASAIGINVLSPLKYDACSRTLSVDCKELFASDCGGCGCGEGVTSTDDTMLRGASSEQGAGLRGAKGEQGEQGTGIATLSVTASGQLMYTLTDGTTRSAGSLPVAKGSKGDRGEKGEKGEKGDKGEDGVGVQGITVKGTTATVLYTNNDSSDVDVSSLKGSKGDTGDKGEKGDKGEAGYSFQYVEVGTDAYIFGYPNTAVTLSSPSLNGMTFGPYTTGSDGLVKITKPTINGQVLMQIKVGSTMVGIGRSN